MSRLLSLLLLLGIPSLGASQTLAIRDRAEEWGRVLAEVSVGLPPVMVDLGGMMPGGSTFNVAGDFRALLQARGFRIIAPEDLQVGAESVVVQCMVTVGETQNGKTPFAYYERVYHWDARQRAMNPVWEAFGLGSSQDTPDRDALFVCTRDIEPVLRKLGYGGG